jgi:AcrR family transcriptional regulator
MALAYAGHDQIRRGKKVERLKERVLSRMRPEAMADTPVKWQQQKAAETRVRILDATIDCLVEQGYSGLSTNEVTLRAGISRGAMHHHFPTRMALVAAVIDYACYVRMERFLEDYFAAIRSREDTSVVEIATEKYWDSVQTREYAAFLELAVAARTDAELNSHFLPAAKRFDKVWNQEMIQSFPQWRDHWDRLQIASDFTMAAMLGLLMHRPVLETEGRAEAVKDLIIQVIGTLHKGIG